MIRFLFLTLFLMVGVAGCANLNTIDRATSLPSESKSDSGKAVHLDIQQRLLVVNEFGTFCAEPSPDALAAYAAAVGIGSSNPSSVATSASASGSSLAASVGIRTQSITLMRDAMFRMCEAYANGVVNSEQVATLLGRSQDLTAVILAVEQLTGPMVARQAALAAATDTSSSASLVAIGDEFELSAKQLERARVSLEQATTEKTKLETQRDELNVEIARKEALRDAIDQASEPEKHAMADAEVAALKRQRTTVDGSITSWTQTISIRTEAFSAAQQRHTEISNRQASALSTTSTGTRGTTDFASADDSSKLDKDGTVKVAETVEKLVSQVLSKSYLEETCLSILSKPPNEGASFSETPEEAAAFKILCSDYFKTRIETEKLELQIRADKAALDLEYAQQAAERRFANSPLPGRVPPPVRDDATNRIQVGIVMCSAPLRWSTGFVSPAVST